MPEASMRGPSRFIERPWKSAGGFLGEGHPDYALSLNNLAILYETRGEYAHAAELLRETLKINKKIFGENHPDYALGLRNLADVYKAQGQYGEAEQLLRQSLEITKKVLGENHTDYALDLEYLARRIPGPGRLCAGRAALPPVHEDPKKRSSAKPIPIMPTA